MKILIFGNPLIEKDNLPLRILPKLKGQFPEIDFKEIEPTESLEKQGRDLVIIDCVEGIDKVVMIEDIDKLVTEKLYSMHDFDLGYNLKLLKKIGKIDSVKVIGVGMKMGEREALEGISNFIKST